MAIKIKNLTVRNFLSVGNQTQAIDFDKGQLTLVLGENLDLGGDSSGSRNGTGKSQPLTASVLTPQGWAKMGSITVGSKVISSDGTVTNVIGVFPQGVLKTYTVTLSDGRSTRTSLDHLWTAIVDNQSVTVTTEQIDQLIKDGHSVKLPAAHQIVLPESNDANLNHFLGSRLDRVYGIINSALKVAFYSSCGSCTLQSEVSAAELVYLIRSLGGVARMTLSETGWEVYFEYNSDRNYNINQFQVSSISVVSVTESVEEECQCIKVDHPSELYITDNFIVTHNTTAVNALSYALYGQALTNIKKDNLINKINGKGMLVTVSFEIDGVEYHIERGRKPTLLKFKVNGHELESSEVDESQGDSRETQKAIEETIKMSHDMFKHLVALNTYSEPFLSMRSGDQRAIIEQLLGITQLSQKADALKESIRQTKELITSETTRIDSIRASNDRVTASIAAIERKKQLWDTQQVATIVQLGEQIQELSDVNIEAEIDAHRALEEWLKNSNERKRLKSSIASFEMTLNRETSARNKYKAELESLLQHKCHACGSELHDEKQNELVAAKTQLLAQAELNIENCQQELSKLQSEIELLGEETKRPEVLYNTLEEALNHKNTINNLIAELEKKDSETNPYTEQIEELKNQALQEIDWSHMNELVKIKDHQEFLHKLLTSKDSFIRKRIIDQNLAFLNQRLTYYLSQIGLPHLVEFQNDLSVTITQLGQDLDFDNLSRGERNRLILCISWAFRDVWENLYTPINLLFIDELLDSGMDIGGIEAGIAILKKMGRERNKNIFLISHKDELTSRVNQVLRVVKESGFTSYSSDVEIVNN